MHIKKLFDWLTLKAKIDTRNHKVPLVREFELYWTNLGANVGSEMDGKNSRFSRPGIIFKKLSQIFYLIIPTTSQKKEGTWYVHFVQGGKDMYACLHQIRVMDYRRLTNRMGQLDEADRDRIRTAFKKLYIK